MYKSDETSFYLITCKGIELFHYIIMWKLKLCENISVFAYSLTFCGQVVKQMCHHDLFLFQVKMILSTLNCTNMATNITSGGAINL